jgi:hypothetical protein
MVKKVGGIWFWRIGRIGGSLYRAKAPAQRWTDVIQYDPITTETWPVRAYAFAAGAMLAKFCFIPGAW